MKLTSASFKQGQALPVRLAFGKAGQKDPIELADNLNPQLSWSDAPAGTQSYVLLCHDPDVPSKPDQVNKKGVTVPASLPRVDFYHWVLVDIPASLSAIAEGEFSRGVTARGKSGPAGAKDTRHGLNGYTQWFAGDADMAGEYFGYDGPCPPFNDEIVHHYHFTLYALDQKRCPIEGTFDGPAVKKAIAGHVLAEAALMGTYTINPDAR